jgi:hypothetical protein
MKPGLFLAAAIVASVSIASFGQDARPIRLPVVRDTWFSNVGSEADANLGGSPRLKLKSIQEMSLVDVDPAPLRGRTVRSATLHVRSTGEPRLKRVTVGSFGAEWFEGTASSYEPQKGSSTHNHKRHPDIPWTVPGSDLGSVILGQGGTAWRMAEASKPDAEGWQTIGVDPLIVAFRVAGLSEGFFLFDDTGTEWSRAGETFTRDGFPNRFLFSKDSNRASAPYLTVDLGPADRSHPAAPVDLRAEAGDLPAGEAWVSWTTPVDEGPAGTVGFYASLDGVALPHYLVPLATAPGERVRMHLRDLSRVNPGELTLAVRAVDGAGNQGPESRAKIRLSTRAVEKWTLGAGYVPIPSALPRLGEGEVAIIDELDKIQPVTGELIPRERVDHLAWNHLWSAKARHISLYAARNEFVGFQVVLKGPIAGAIPSLTFDGVNGSKIRVEFARYHHVQTSKGPLPDPIVPLDQEEFIEGRKSSSLHIEVYVPHDVPRGERKGTLTLEAGGEKLALAVSLLIWDFTLPDHLSFLPEMNCYGLPENERDFYRLAHRHRTFLNRLPYNQNGTIQDGCAPRWDGKALDWSNWDRRFGPLLDGSAFADLPRQGVPVDGFYLPLHENWPTPIEGNYNGDYWADRAFKPSYRASFVEASRQFAEHLHVKGWKQTLFQGFLNNKVDFKSRGWSRGSSPWLLDEPANTQDFWALRYFASAFHEGVNQAKDGPAKLAFRADISRPQWQRDILDGLLDYNVVGGAMRPYRRIVLDRKEAEGQVVVEYGTANAIEDSNMQAVGWCLDAWSLGMDGVLPWQTIGRSESWSTGDPLALFYPSRTGGEPSPSIRLKAYRRGQQDVEYLTLLGQIQGEPRWMLGQNVREQLKLVGNRQSANADDAGQVRYDRFRPQDEWTLRLRLGEALSARHPTPKRQLLELRTPRRDPSKLAHGEVFGIKLKN